MLLGEDGLPTGLLSHVGLTSSDLEFRLDELKSFLNINRCTIELEDSLSSIVVATLLDVPNRRLGKERKTNGEESRDEESHDKSKSEAPFALDLGRTPARDGGEEKAQNNDDVGEGAERASKCGGCILCDVQRRRDS